MLMLHLKRFEHRRSPGAGGAGEAPGQGEAGAPAHSKRWSRTSPSRSRCRCGRSAPLQCFDQDMAVAWLGQQRQQRRMLGAWMGGTTSRPWWCTRGPLKAGTTWYMCSGRGRGITVMMRASTEWMHPPLLQLRHTCSFTGSTASRKRAPSYQACISCLKEVQPVRVKLLFWVSNEVAEGNWDARGGWKRV